MRANLDSVPYSVYVHIPFCQTRCAYCDFNTYAGQQDRIPAYVSALLAEIRAVAGSSRERLGVHTVFFGGGTPSLLPVASLGEILATIGACFDLDPGAEISLEANPGTVSADGLKALRQAGFNRLSLGMQSAKPEELRLLQRGHSTLDVIQAVRWAREAGFENVNLDLIYGIPGQTLNDWQTSLRLAIEMGVEHLSLYALGIEEGTPFYHWVRKGLVEDTDDDLAADEYEWATEALEEAGFRQYEISNWARVDAGGRWWRCRHNEQYWYDLPYLGFGAGAHGFAGGVRTINAMGIQGYVRRCELKGSGTFPVGPATIEAKPIDRWTEMQETMMVGLRLTDEGVSKETFLRRFGVPMGSAFGEPLSALMEKGLLEDAGDRVRLTRRGRLLGNIVFREFVD